MNGILDELTAPQREAVTHINGPLLIIAGPGSGKTRVITRRVAHLLHCGIHPWNILAITFTNKAAAEMRERVEAMGSRKGVILSTFHSFCARVMREFAERVGYRKDFTIYDSDDSAKVIRDIVKARELPLDQFKARDVHGKISVAKERLIGAEEYAATAGDFAAETLAKIYLDYEARLREANALDFDDLIMKTALLMENDAEALERLRKRHQFVLVDEFQDTNRSQYTISHLLTREHRNLCVTGDPDQSIYGWRGADINNILDFEKDYPEAKVVFLNQNYRSTQTILAAANQLVCENQERRARDLHTENPVGEQIRVVQCRDSRDEGRRIARTARALIAEGHQPRDIAVFYRMNALSRQIEEAFVQDGLPYQVVGGVEFYSRAEVKDILAYLRIAANPTDEASILRVINTPARGLGAKTLQVVRAWAAAQGLPLYRAITARELLATMPAKAAGALLEFASVIEKVREVSGKSAQAGVRTAIKASGYLKMLEESDDKDDKERIANLDELINAAAQYDQAEDADGLEGFLERTVLASDIDNWRERENRVTLMTMHAAKGLEFPAVIIAGLEEGILPYAGSHAGKTELEEERRVFFVAMTRAKEKLYLFRSDERMLHGAWASNLPSRFIREIPSELCLVERDDDGFAGAGAARRHGAPSGRQAGPSQWRLVPSQDRGGAARAGAAPPARAAGGGDTMQNIPPVKLPSNIPPVGSRVRHKEFGVGVVKAVSPQGQWHKATIGFPLAGVKKLIVEKADLELLK